MPDPCEIGLADCLRVHLDGRIEALNEHGELLIDVLALDEPPARARRRFVIGNVLSHAESNWKMFVEWMRYPDDLPDLTQFRPAHNDKPEGVDQSHFARKQRNELPEVY